MYEMCKICLRSTIKLSTCMPVELCMKCAPTPKDCITLLDKKERISKIECTKHIKEECKDFARAQKNNKRYYTVA